MASDSHTRELLDADYNLLRAAIAVDLNDSTLKQHKGSKRAPGAAPIVILIILVHCGFVRFWPPSEAEFKQILFLLRHSRKLTDTTLFSYANYMVAAIRATDPLFQKY
jgi:hypothetical protein